MQEIFESYLNLVWSYWLADLEVLSLWWVWVTILPALGYILFMTIKWSFLTMPIWLPIKFIRMIFKKRPSYYTSTGDYRKDLLNARLATLKRLEEESKKN